MSYDLLATVVLSKDLPEHNLRAGDVGTVVECYGDSAVEVEFVTGSGHTLAVVTLQNDLIREIGEADVSIGTALRQCVSRLTRYPLSLKPTNRPDYSATLVSGQRSD